MRGGKIDDKVVGPLFPRLHVNDTEKGGPRAPPRNKMALYEQLSVPSQRFTSPGNSMFHTMPYHTNTLVASASSSQGYSQERSVFSPFYMPPASIIHSTEKSKSQSSNGMNLNATATEFEKKSTTKGSYRAAKVAKLTSSATDSNSFCANYISSSKKSSEKKIRDTDDSVVPTCVNSATVQGFDKTKHEEDRDRTAPSMKYLHRSTITAPKISEQNAATTRNASSQLYNSSERQTKILDLKLGQPDMKSGEEKRKETVALSDHPKKSGSHELTRENIAQVAPPSKKVSLSLDHDCNSIDEIQSPKDKDQQSYQDTGSGLSPGGDGNAVADGERNLRVRGEWYLRRPLQKRLNEVENDDEVNRENVQISMQVGDADRTDDSSDTSMVDSIPRFDISPDDVVGVIGQKHFWKARKAIVNQQRVFAIQVFELHRLIKVQKLIAGSPELLFEYNHYIGKPSQITPIKKLPSEYHKKSQLEVVKLKDDSQKPRKNTDHSAADTFKKPSQALPVNESVIQGHNNQHSNCGPCSENPSATPAATEKNSGPWCFHPPPGNQWLIPVISPSEGLVYKPFAGPCPPPAGFMAPVFGGCGHTNVPPVPLYGLPSSHHQPMVQSYFPPYSAPTVTPITPVVEQTNPPNGAQKPHEQAEQISTRELNFKSQSGGSCNVSNQKSEAFSSCVRKFPTSKESEFQGSSVSSPCVKVQGASHVSEGCNMLPLFPTSPATKGADHQSVQSPYRDQQPRVIKVVPHNPRTASESAARIFQSIQEERRQNNSL